MCRVQRVSSSVPSLSFGVLCRVLLRMPQHTTALGSALPITPETDGGNGDGDDEEDMVDGDCDGDGVSGIC